MGGVTLICIWHPINRFDQWAFGKFGSSYTVQRRKHCLKEWNCIGWLGPRHLSRTHRYQCQSFAYVAFLSIFLYHNWSFIIVLTTVEMTVLMNFLPLMRGWSWLWIKLCVQEGKLILDIFQWNFLTLHGCHGHWTKCCCTKLWGYHLLD